MTDLYSQDIETIKETARQLYKDTRYGSHKAFSIIMDVLLSRMPESEYVRFCAELEDDSAVWPFSEPV